MREGRLWKNIENRKFYFVSWAGNLNEAVRARVGVGFSIFNKQSTSNAMLCNDNNAAKIYVENKNWTLAFEFCLKVLNISIIYNDHK